MLDSRAQARTGHEWNAKGMSQCVLDLAKREGRRAVCRFVPICIRHSGQVAHRGEKGNVYLLLPYCNPSNHVAGVSFSKITNGWGDSLWPTKVVCAESYCAAGARSH